MENIKVKETQPRFNPDVFRAKFDELFKAWKKKWSTVGHHGATTGPMRIYERQRQYLSEALLKAQEPEDRAHQGLLEFCAQEIIRTRTINESNTVLVAIDDNLSKNLTGGQIHIKYEILLDIFSELLRIDSHSK